MEGDTSSGAVVAGEVAHHVFHIGRAVVDQSHRDERAVFLPDTDFEQVIDIRLAQIHLQLQ